jgi:hypothetical protein
MLNIEDVAGDSLCLQQHPLNSSSISSFTFFYKRFSPLYLSFSNNVVYISFSIHKYLY